MLAAGGARVSLPIEALDDLAREDEPAPASVPLDHLAERWAMLRYASAKAKEWSDIAKEARADIEEALGDAETGTIDGKPVVRFYWRKTRRLNQAALKADHPEVIAAYTTPTEERRFEPVKEEES